MGTGRITDFSQKNATGNTQLKRLEQTRYASNVEVLDAKHGGQPMPVEVRAHEELVVEDTRKVRLKKDGSPDMRFRNAPTRKEWEEVKRGTWEPR